MSNGFFSEKRREELAMNIPQVAYIITYRIRAYRTPLLNRTPLGAFWAHIGHFCMCSVQNQSIFGQETKK